MLCGVFIDPLFSATRLQAIDQATSQCPEWITTVRAGLFGDVFESTGQGLDIRCYFFWCPERQLMQKAGSFRHIGKDTRQGSKRIGAVVRLAGPYPAITELRTLAVEIGAVGGNASGRPTTGTQDEATAGDGQDEPDPEQGRLVVLACSLFQPASPRGSDRMQPS